MSIKVRTRSILTLPKRLSIIEDLPNDLVEEKARKCPPPQRVTHLNDAMCERPSHCVIDVLSHKGMPKISIKQHYREIFRCRCSVDVLPIFVRRTGCGTDGLPRSFVPYNSLTKARRRLCWMRSNSAKPARLLLLSSRIAVVSIR